MSLLNINYNELEEVSSNILLKGSEFSYLLNVMKNYNSKLQQVWEGTDSIVYTEKLTEQLEQMQKLSESINEIGLFLKKVSFAYKDTQEQIANTIRNY